VLAFIKRPFQAVSRFYHRLNTGLDKRPWIFYGLIAVFILLAAFIRFWAAPLSAGPDVSQFWGFAKLFEMHGLNFYQYADGSDPLLANEGWPFVYPPLWLFILRIALFIVPGSLASPDMVDAGWRVAVKTPIIAADLAVGALLVWAIPGSKLKKLFFGFIWLFHPTAWYNSAVFGQFDAIAAALLLISLIMLLKGRDRLGFIFAGLAILTKQHATLPALLMLAVLWRQLKWQRLLENCAIVAGMFVLVSLPFIFNGNLVPYLRSVFFPAQAPSYQTPLVYAFGGIGAFLTYLHEAWSLNTEWLFVYCIPLLAVAVITAVILCYVKKIRLEQAAIIGILLFIALFYRVNYQYLIMYLPLAIYALAVSRRWVERGFLIGLIALPAVWIWLFDVSFWFWYLKPHGADVPQVLKTLGLVHYTPDQVFVSLAVLLMALCLVYAGTVLFHRRQDQALVN
jgi:hypothetical protein